MNTLNKEQTAEFYKDENGYDEMVRRWKKLIKENELGLSQHHLLYSVLRGRDWRRGFSEVTNQYKRGNGAAPYYQAEQALINARSSNLDFMNYFEDILVDDIRHQLKEILPQPWGVSEELPKNAYEVVAND